MQKEGDILILWFYPVVIKAPGFKGRKLGGMEFKWSPSEAFFASSPPDWSSLPILTLLMTAKSFAGDFSDRGKALFFTTVCIDEQGFETLPRSGVQIQKLGCLSKLTFNPLHHSLAFLQAKKGQTQRGVAQRGKKTPPREIFFPRSNLVLIFYLPL